MTRRLDELLARAEAETKPSQARPRLDALLIAFQRQSGGGGRKPSKPPVVTLHDLYQPTLRRMPDALTRELGVLISNAVRAIEDPDVAQIMMAREQLVEQGYPLPEETEDERATLERYLDEGWLSLDFTLREMLGLHSPRQIPGMPLSATDADLERAAEGLLWLATAVRGEVYDDEEVVAKASRAGSEKGGQTHILGEVEQRVRGYLGLPVLAQISDLTKRVIPVDKSVAKAFIQAYHRTLPKLNPLGLIATVGLEWGGTLTAVAAINRPTARAYATRKEIIDISRIATDGRVFGASSALARWVLQHAHELVDTDLPPKVITYSLLYEHGDTYKALVDEGMRAVELTWGKTGGGARPDDTAQKGEPKIRWEWGADAGAHDPSLLRLARAWRSYRTQGHIEGLSGLNQARLADMFRLVFGHMPLRRDTPETLRERLRAARRA